MTSQQQYYPYGEPRAGGHGNSPTDFGFTSQRNEASFGLMERAACSKKYYNARYYSPLLGRFVSPDSIVPEPSSSGSFNRYRYARNSPLMYTDPTGHFPCADDIGNCRPPVQVNIVSREQWGASDPSIIADCGYDGACIDPGYNEGFYQEGINDSGYAEYSDLATTKGQSLEEILFEVVIHHSGNDPDFDMMLLQHAHMFGRGMTDVGYHFAIHPDGTIYEGRAIHVRGNHAFGNTGRVGILLMGDFHPGDTVERYGLSLDIPLDWDSYGPPTDAQIQQASELIRSLDVEYGISSVVGHQQVPDNYTECPGSLCLPFIPQLNNVAQELQ